MKSIYQFIFAALLLGGMTSCNDMLDTVPQGQFTAEQLDENSVEGLLASAYAGLEAHFYGNNEAFAGPSTNWIFDVRSDDAYKGGGGTGMEENIHLLEVSEVNSDNVSCLNKWQNNYYAISRVHNAMLAVQQAESISNAAQILGELKTLRAWYYFDLIRIFNRIPYFTEGEDVNTKPNDEYTRDEIFSFIKRDLTEAIEVLPAEKSNVGRITRTTAQAIMAKVCAFTSSWEDVKTYADAVINSGQYSLYDNFGDLSKIERNNGSESIFALQCSTANDNAHINWSNLLNCTYSDGNLYGTGDDFFYGSQNLVNAFRTDPNSGLPYLDGTFNKVNVTLNYSGTLDPRLDLTVGRIGMPWRGHTYTQGWCRAYDVYGEYSNKKAWPAPEKALASWPWGCNSLNFMFIRYADILLLKAEALVETATRNNAAEDPGLIEARKLVNQVRQRAANSVDPNYSPVDLDPFMADYFVGLYPTDGDGNLYWTKDRARAAVRFERRLELALEGNRWFDLVRWGSDYLISTMNTYMTEESALRSYYQGRSISANEIFLPVPLDEIDNSNGLYKQY
ncbi:MAG: RagB/SusD family nutrient uptake outer membrane protein [Prevotella sp.]|nr:RagB/SusD family nutrient uptake outer membrane protein [Prevotella sp.]MBR6945013.1 RagB/SusD family nutrient uptake outer membrane protein [Prevotella sp.]